MMKATLGARGFVFGMMVASTMILACSSDKGADAPAPLLSRKGESCEVRNDCDPGLACVNQICITSEFNVAPNANGCDIIECTQPQDCCPEMSSSCQQYEQSCKNGDNYACQQFDQYCKCDAGSWNCDNGKCMPNLSCAQNKPCPGYLFCDVGQGKCVECLGQSDCDTSKTCVANRCVNKCNLDSDCPLFNRCENQQCVDSGCKTDRECMAATKNASAFCVAGTCHQPCQSNIECGNPEKAFNFQACILGQCTYLGCESDKECELFLGEQGDGKHKQVVCRPQP
ncbi:MAG: hypothetical protein HY898_16875 [Deltaproteobacteria bacterium]|nr:hypothetical protein [Deltaproteobacteria bacterium]